MPCNMPQSIVPALGISSRSSWLEWHHGLTPRPDMWHMNLRTNHCSEARLSASAASHFYAISCTLVPFNQLVWLQNEQLAISKSVRYVGEANNLGCELATNAYARGTSFPITLSSFALTRRCLAPSGRCERFERYFVCHA